MMPLLYPTSCKCSTESFVNSASPFPLLFFLEEKKQKKIICGTGSPAAPAAFAGLQHKNGQLACERPFFVPRRMCENVFSTLIILSRYVFCFFSSRKEIVPLLFFLEEKKQKKISSRIGFCASLYILRNPVAQNGRLTYEPAVFSFQAGCARKRLLSEIFPLSRYVFCFFSSRKEIVPLLFFLEEKKQKKIICGTGSPAAPAAFAGLQHKNGQLACERPFFVPRRMCENVFSTLIILSRYVFCFFSSRKEIVP
ncbi:MAG: hypothetical protein Q4C27_04940 [Eubacteriales bacterium]|nr:hypothetical protein [Eubacteriales bacterium]